MGVGWSLPGVVACAVVAGCSPVPAPSGPPPAVTPAVASAPPAALVPLENGAARRLGEARFALGGEPRELAFSPDGTRLAGCGPEVGIAIWEVPSGRLVSRASPMITCTALAFMPDGKRLVAAGLTNFTNPTAPIVSIDAATGAVIARTGATGRDNVWPIVIVDDDTVAVGASGGFSFWRIDADAPPLTRIDWPVPDREMARRGGTLAYVSGGRELVVLDARTGKERCSADLKEYDEHVDISPDESTVAVGGSRGVERFGLPGCTAAPFAGVGHVRRLRYGGDGVLRVAVSRPAGDELVVGPLDALPRAMTLTRVEPLSPALSADGRWLAARTEWGAQVVDLASGERHRGTPHDRTIEAAGVLNDGTAVTISWDDAALWRSGAVSSERIFSAAPPFEARAALHPSGDRIALEVSDEKNANLLEVVRLPELVREPVRRVQAAGWLGWMGDELLGADGWRGWLLAADGSSESLHVSSFRSASCAPSGRHCIANEEGALGRPPYVFDRTGARRTFPEDVKYIDSVVAGERWAFTLDEQTHQDDPTVYEMRAFSLPDITAVPVPEDLEHATAMVIVAEDERRFAFGFADGRIALTEKDFAVKRTLSSGAGRVTAIGVSPNREWLVTAHADGQAFVWRLE